MMTLVLSVEGWRRGCLAMLRGVVSRLVWSYRWLASWASDDYRAVPLTSATCRRGNYRPPRLGRRRRVAAILYSDLIKRTERGEMALYVNSYCYYNLLAERHPTQSKTLRGELHIRYSKTRITHYNVFNLLTSYLRNLLLYEVFAHPCSKHQRHSQ